MIRIVIIEGQALLRLGLVNAISQSSVMEVCGEVACAAEGIELVAQTLPDIVIINISLPDMGGIEATIAIKQQFDCKVVILTDQDDEEIVALALSAGADSYLLSTSEPEILRYAIIKTKEGECWIDPKLPKNFLFNSNKAKEEKNTNQKGKKFGVTLTSTELRTLKLMARGLSNEQIAKTMNVTEGTVKCYVHLVNKKLQAHNRVHAVMRGVKLGYFNYNSVIFEVLGTCPEKRYQPS
ncbi:response regulator [aff. Roholtiella sp. LEGE 12411]|uniref:response regulator n=1 Tax=aff. Roholtiella sp. LEGE 12411 TaxID=1828822 RepID=UPI001881F72E|nr:response regulator transcription factor [aff. Roholtiella sp. LEGE 12411]MBE9036594.1 response regulator transcription factor [aff. Roholtiella sp. LEGE 12411]